jgi:hypothetical protein
MIHYKIFTITIILILLIIIINFSSNYIKEPFVNGKSFNSINNIWMYWENKKNMTKPNYLSLCFDTVQKHCHKKFNIFLLDEVSVYKYLPDLSKDLDKKLSIQQKSDYIRYYLLYKYGGIWLDSDTIIMNDLTSIVKHLEYYDFVGFGCHYGDVVCKRVKSGKPYPANWVMASVKNGKLMGKCLEYCDNILKNPNIRLHTNYFVIGRTLMWKMIKRLKSSNWDYYHYPSKCLERDSSGNKLRNNRSISNESIDKVCKNHYLFIPIYNTAPGFPNWFINMSKKELLSSNMLISKLFRKSLNINFKNN